MDLAILVGVTPSRMSAIVCAKSVPTDDEVLAIDLALSPNAPIEVDA